MLRTEVTVGGCRWAVEPIIERSLFYGVNDKILCFCGQRGHPQVFYWAGGPPFPTFSRFETVGAPLSRFLRGRVGCCGYYGLLCPVDCIALMVRITCTLSLTRAINAGPCWAQHEREITSYPCLNKRASVTALLWSAMW